MLLFLVRRALGEKSRTGSAGKCSPESVLELLPWDSKSCLNTTRQNIVAKRGRLTSLALGLVASHGQKLVVSNLTKQFPDVVRYITAYGFSCMSMSIGIALIGIAARRQ